MSTPYLQPWDVRETDFPAAGTPAEKFSFLLNYAVLAPSSHNSQPWLFRIVADSVELYADRSRGLAVIDPDDRELTISCGAALFHLRIALRRFGYIGAVTTFPDADDPDLLARIHLGIKRDATPEAQALFAAIYQRRTNRQAFEQRPLPEDMLVALQEAAHTEGAWLYIVRGEKDRNAVADLISLADGMQWQDKHFRRELVAWARTTRMQRQDGIPTYALNLGGLTTQVGLRAGRTFDLGNGQAANDRQLAMGSPALVVLGTHVDTVYDWLIAGQALARVLLHARSQGVWASFLNQPIEVPEVRPMLHNVIERAGFPQLLLRLGYGPDIPPTPRRRLSEVLL